MSEPLAVRQAALLLHGLAPGVRGAVLARLGRSDTERLQPLLSELAEMGVSPALGRRLNAASEVSSEQRLEQLTGAVVAHAVSACAPVTVAHLFRSREWPWRPAALACLPDAVRVPVLECLRRELPPLGPAAMRRLCERVCEHIDRIPAAGLRNDSGTASRRSQLARIFRWMR
jgi:hypothetical protein